MPNIDQRRIAVIDAVSQIRSILDAGINVENLNSAKAALISLAARTDLFSFDAFPLPEDDAMECSYLIHEFDDGSYSLYVNSGAAHQYYAPHDHGNAWAIIAGVRGSERHQLYLKNDRKSSGDDLLQQKGVVVVSAGSAVTMPPEGIHEVNAMYDEPLLHLHLYAKNFVLQGERWKYDLQHNLVEPFHLSELGSIKDAR